MNKVFSFIAGVCVLLVCACGRPEHEPVDRAADYRRVVTLSPSLSETLYALGLGDRVVGVTKFARYPAEVASKPKIGGYTDVNVEAVYALKPDLVLALDQQESIVRQLRSLGLTVCTFRNGTLDDTVDLIRRSGALFNRTNEAAALCGAIETERDRLAEKAANRPRRRVLISVGRNMGSGAIGDIYAAGPGTLFGQIIQLAGAENVYQGPAPYTALRKEAILRLNPEVIIDLIPDMDLFPDFSAAAVREQWNEFSGVDAVRSGRITINGASYICMPGPRLVLMLRDLDRCMYPEETP